MRRLICLADGTWKSAESETITNVVVMRKAIALKSPDGIDQKVYYHAGVGTGSLLDKFTGGAFGAGIDDNIKDVYTFLVENYEPGDAIFMLGFSRGAYTVRSAVGMARKCGILRKENLDRLKDVYALYRKDHATADDPEPVAFRQQFSQPPVEIAFLGVWDTVGALGIPLAGLRSLTRRQHQFHNTKLSGIVKRAFHAVAVDERRGSFVPTLWETTPDPSQVVEQSWFTGVHSDIGGGYTDRTLADITFAWMASRAAAAGLYFEPGFLTGTMGLDVTGELALDAVKYKGELHNSRTGLYRLFRAHDRVIGRDTSKCESVWHTASLRLDDQALNYGPKNLEAYLALPEKMVAGPPGIAPAPGSVVV